MRLLLSDLDGVVRHFPANQRDAIEERFGLDVGVLARHGFEPRLLDEVITGRRTRESWTEEVGRRVGSSDAARAWLAERGAIDDQVLAYYDQVRASGYLVAVLTNGTDTVEAELREFGVFDRFDAVFSTASIGFAKSDVRAFRHVIESMHLEPAQVMFTDDSVSKMSGATEAGMATHHFAGLEGLRRACSESGFALEKSS